MKVFGVQLKDSASCHDFKRSFNIISLKKKIHDMNLEALDELVWNHFLCLLSIKSVSESHRGRMACLMACNGQIGRGLHILLTALQSV